MTFFARLSYFLLLIGSTFVHAMDAPDSLTQSHTEAEAHPLKRNCGKIMVGHSNGKDLLDYCSAVVVENQAVLSACHILHDSRKQDPECYFYFCSYDGKKYAIDPIRALAPKREILDPNDDLALFYLQEPIHDTLHIKISTRWMQPTKEKLFSLTYGWKLNLEISKYTVHNTMGNRLYYITGTYHPFGNTYIQMFDADRAVQMSTPDGKSRELYVGKPGSPSQIFLCDSGAPWFKGNEVDGYTLCGITSTIEQFDPKDIQQENLAYQGDFKGINATLSLKVYGLKNNRAFKNQLTAVAPHESWITSNINVPR
jgi:hypothetical protein